MKFRSSMTAIITMMGSNSTIVMMEMLFYICFVEIDGIVKPMLGLMMEDMGSNCGRQDAVGSNCRRAGRRKNEEEYGVKLPKGGRTPVGSNC